jgi:hypothetical protein
VFDGEGSVFLIRQPNRGKREGINDRLVVKVVNTDARMIQKLREIAGGRINAMKPRTKRHMQPWEWIVTGVHAKNFLQAIRPYLVVKGEQADVALEFTTGVRGGGRGHKLDPIEDAKRDSIRERLHVLKRGVA